MMQGLRSELLASVFEAMQTALAEGSKSANAMVVNDSYTVDAYISRDDAEVLVNHDNGHESPNVEAALTEAVKALSWAEAEKALMADLYETPEEQYARIGEMMFAPELRWGRI